MSRIRSIPGLLLLVGLCCASGCAGFFAGLAPPALAPQEIAKRVADLRYQLKAVRTLSWVGTVNLDAQGTRSEAGVLVVARRDPPALRIEITHAWGRPLLHIQVEEARVDIVSFSEKRLYQGRLGKTEPPKEVPFPLDPDLLWSLARAYPALPPVRYAESWGEGQITLTDDQGRAIQVIDFSPDGRPAEVQLYGKGTSMSFSDYHQQDGILYAGKVQATSPEAATALTLEVKEMTFNRPVPEAIFRQEAPADFELVAF